MKIAKQPLHLILTTYLKERPRKKIHGGQMERVSQSWGYEAETGKRRLREVTNPLHDNYNPHVWKDYEDGCVIYWYENRRKRQLA